LWQRRIKLRLKYWKKILDMDLRRLMKMVYEEE